MAGCELERILDRVWSNFSDAISSADSCWRLMCLATQGDDGMPHARMVVLRGFDFTSQTLTCYTDPRTPKWSQLEENPRAEACFWDSTTKVQLRAQCDALLSSGDDFSNDCQAQVPTHLAGDYRALTIPGDILPEPEQGHPLGNEWHFGVIRLKIEMMDWLALSQEGHQRARFQREGDHWKSHWVQP